jgi:hypothetical protein
MSVKFRRFYIILQQNCPRLDCLILALIRLFVFDLRICKMLGRYGRSVTVGQPKSGSLDDSYDVSVPAGYGIQFFFLRSFLLFNELPST